MLLRLGGGALILPDGLVGITTSEIPITALICNICVVSIISSLSRYPLPIEHDSTVVCIDSYIYLRGQTEISPAFFRYSVRFLSSADLPSALRDQMSLTIPMTVSHCVIIGGLLGGLAAGIAVDIFRPIWPIILVRHRKSHGLHPDSSCSIAYRNRNDWEIENFCPI